MIHDIVANHIQSLDAHWLKGAKGPRVQGLHGWTSFLFVSPSPQHHVLQGSERLCVRRPQLMQNVEPNGPSGSVFFSSEVMPPKQKVPPKAKGMAWHAGVVMIT